MISRDILSAVHVEYVSKLNLSALNPIGNSR